MSSRQINWTAHNLPRRPSSFVPASPQAAAHAAAEERNLNRNMESIVDRMERVALFCPLAEEKRPFHQLLDDQLLARTSTQQAIETLNNLSELVENELAWSEGPQLSIRCRNLKMKRTIIDVAGAVDYLILCGFRKSTRDFEERLGFTSPRTPARIYDLRVGLHVLTTTLQRTTRAYELERIRRAAARQESEGRTRSVLLQIAEDARLRREREERRRQGRRAREGGEGRAVDQNPVHDAEDWY